MSFLFKSAVLGLVVLFLIWYSKSRSKPAKGLREVPGPPGLPILGNAHQISKHPQRDSMRWAKEYGEIYKIRLGWNDWYMINSPEAVKDIMDRQSAHTSSRPPQPVASDALSGGLRFLFMPYGPEWRKLRALAHQLLTPKMSDTFQPSQDFEAKQLLHDILTDNKDESEFYMHTRRYTTSVIMTSTYGRRIPDWVSFLSKSRACSYIQKDCEDVREIYRLMKDFSEVAAPGRYIADTIPPLGRLPISLQWWRKSIEPLFFRQARLWMKYWYELKTQLEAGKAPACFVKQFIEERYEKLGITELQAAFLAGCKSAPLSIIKLMSAAMIEAGSETTSAALNSCVLYLAAYPEVQERAQKEIDAVVGDSRSPTFEDESSLPYIRAIAKELLRLRPVTNIGSPHYSTKDIIYKDFFIPQGSVICLQQYPIHFDEVRYPEPEKFKPERYLDHPHDSGYYAAAADPYERDHFSFGAGRRICSGVHLAENSLYITIAKLLWAFDVRPPHSADGQEERMDLSDDAYEPGANTIPKPFRARFVPRSKKIENVIKEEWQRAQKDGYTLRDVQVDTAGMIVD